MKGLVEPMKYHGPGWTLDRGSRGYLLWAPRSAPTLREEWTACWFDTDHELAGDFVRGAEAAEVLACFPASVRAAFIGAVGQWIAAGSPS